MLTDPVGDRRGVDLQIIAKSSHKEEQNSWQRVDQGIVLHKDQPKTVAGCRTILTQEKGTKYAY